MEAVTDVDEPWEALIRVEIASGTGRTNDGHSDDVPEIDVVGRSAVSTDAH